MVGSVRGRGFSLIEVLVTIAIITILFGLVVSAVMSARESARRARCGQNLKQIGLALNAYASTFGTLPLGYGGGGNGISFLVSILPYTENNSLYNLIDMKVGPSGTIRNMSLASYLCPSDGFVRSDPQGATNYAGNQGSGVQEYGYNGAFSRSSPVGLADFPDGASHTAAVSEWLTGPNTGAVREPRRSVFSTAEPFRAQGQLELFAGSCSRLDLKTAPLSPVVIGVPWTHGDFGHSLYNHVMPVNSHHCLNGSLFQEGAWTAMSNHGRGANVLLVDGHVRFTNESLAISVWRALGSRNGGEVIAGDLGF
jgi:prepilin-type N-terminal cleavage/methylation domain-containing protein/prepilin-type processing-associated H-X9-DG protein